MTRKKNRTPWIMKPGVFSGETVTLLRHIVETHQPGVAALQHDWALQIFNTRRLLKSIPLIVEDIAVYKLHETYRQDFEEYVFKTSGINSLKEECEKLVKFLNELQNELALKPNP